MFIPTPPSSSSSVFFRNQQEQRKEEDPLLPLKTDEQYKSIESKYTFFEENENRLKKEIKNLKNENNFYFVFNLIILFFLIFSLIRVYQIFHGSDLILVHGNDKKPPQYPILILDENTDTEILHFPLKNINVYNKDQKKQVMGDTFGPFF
jgi:hypothetical protein